jgi:hypothetical protein
MAQARRTQERSKRFTPVEAAYAVAQFFPADPAVWLERCALAAMHDLFVWSELRK